MKRVVLKRGRARPAWAGHPWIFSGAIADAPSIELLESIVGRHRRHLAWAEEVFDRLVDTAEERERREQRRRELGARLRACGGVTGDWPIEPENTVEAVRKEKST